MAAHDEELGTVPAVPDTPSGIPLKQISLITLALQNSLLTLVMHYSRVSTPPSSTYSAATAVLLNEIFKGLISLAIAFLRTEPTPDVADPLLRLRRLVKDIFSPDCWKLSIPAILYVIQNNLQYVAASNLDAATFQVTYQIKILTTASFSVLLLRRKLFPPQWLALLFLAIGVGIVQIQAGPMKLIPEKIHIHPLNPLKGFVAVTAACFTSGLAGVYFEMVLKNSQADLWVRNVQLSLFSLLPALAPVILSVRHVSGIHAILSALFHDFGPWAWATVAIQVVGGLITAIVIKYSDNILKGFATSLSIVISSLASVLLFDFAISSTFVLGSVIVLVATWLYNQPQKRIVTVKNTESLVWTVTQTSANFNSQRSPAPPSSYLKRVASSTSSLCSLSSVLSSPPLSDEKASYVR